MINHGFLAGARHVPAKRYGGKITPRYIVLHDTAGPSLQSCLAWFKNPRRWSPSRKRMVPVYVSAHFVVDYDGAVVQCVSCDRKAYHAGRSSWNGVVSLNAHAIGIEIVNPGKMDQSGKTYFGTVPGEREHAKTAEHGDGYWKAYTPAQIETVVRLCREIMDAYPDCNEIVTHWQISPGRKVDTNPLFPLDEVKRRVLEDADEVDELEKVPSVPNVPVAAARTGTAEVGTAVAVGSAGTAVSEAIIAAPPAATTETVQNITAWQSMSKSAIGLAEYGAAKWPWLLGAAAIYYAIFHALPWLQSVNWTKGKRLWSRG